MYVRDGYTTSSNYPYAQRIDLGDAARRNELGSRGVEGIGNYIRNSVKAVVDAYTGKVTLYAFDENDPILKAWRKAFPNLFKAQAEIPDDLRPHLRYPEDLFSIQTWIYASYHIPSADDFYSKEDFWALPDDRSGEIRRQEDTGGLAATTSVKARPYYLLTKLPDRPEPEFVLVMPFTPNGKENMVSYLAAQADPADYGRLTLFSLDRSRTILGPTQVNARILATPAISSSLTLLNQQGSRVILSNLLIVPVEDSLVYVQPIFVQGSAPNSFPLLQRVAVFYNNQVGYADNLTDAIAQVVSGQQATPTPPDDGTPTQPPPPTPGGGGNQSVQSLLTQANNEYKAAQDALANHDLAEYQAHIDRMGRLIQQALAAQGDSTTTTTRR
jgi:hypothetical protein